MLLRFCLALMLALVAMTAPSPARARVGLVGTPLSVCVLPAMPGMEAAALFRAPARFDCRTPQRRFGRGDYWAMSSRLPAIAGPVEIRFASLWQRSLTLYVLYADGAIHRSVMDDRALSRRVQLGAMISDPVPTRGAAPVRLLWHIEGAENAYGILNGASITTAVQAARSNLAMAAIYAAFGGLAMALFVYNLALWMVLRHSFQLAYCAMLVGLTVYTVSSSGGLAWIWPGIANTLRMRINFVMLACSASAAVLFARCFFESHVFDRRLRAMSSATIVMLVSSGALFAAMAPWHFHLLNQLFVFAFIVLLVTAGAILWRGWRMRSNYLWVFAIAWAAPIVFATLRVAGNFDLIGWNFWVDNSTILAMASEALLSSVAIAYRIRLLSVERDEAREKELAARMLADIDPLTGLLNRRGFLREAMASGDDQRLFIIDIDHFKRINDTLGHDGGDEVLRLVARALRAAAPEDALVARIGGEEFAVLVGIFTRLTGEALMARVRTERMPYDVPVTVSVGTAAGAIGDEGDWRLLYRRADRALFEAKAAGRDRARELAG